MGSNDTETAVQTAVRLEYSRLGGRLWRNNVGAVYTADGKFLRYGLANDSKALNQKIKSSDLIGILPVIITPEMVGARIGQFVAIECKHPGWVYRGTDRERAQLRFLHLVVSLGGRGEFKCTSII